MIDWYKTKALIITHGRRFKFGHYGGFLSTDIIRFSREKTNPFSL